VSSAGTVGHDCVLIRGATSGRKLQVHRSTCAVHRGRDRDLDFETMHAKRLYLAGSVRQNHCGILGASSVRTET
jgi:hypothetical protein